MKRPNGHGPYNMRVTYGNRNSNNIIKKWTYKRTEWKILVEKLNAKWARVSGITTIYHN